MLAKRIKQRLAVTPVKYKVRHVTFTPEEMAIDAGDVDASRIPVIARGEEEWQRFLSFKRGYVHIDPDLRRVFKDKESVNRALRKLIEAMPVSSSRKRKTA